MRKALTYAYIVLSTGFAMFSMFFGSGNLVFPLIIGKSVGDLSGIAAMGLTLTGVVVPFLGLIAIILYNGKYEEFFARLGKYAPFLLPLLMLSIMGPFGVLPRCITVAHGSFRLVWPEVDLSYFSIAACVVIFFLVIDKRKIVPLLGSILTPFLLISLCFIIFYGLLESPGAPHFPMTKSEAFKIGALKGYQLMDLLAAFFFSTFVIKHLSDRLGPDTPRKKVMGMMISSSVVGAILLGIIYVCFVYLGSAYAPFLGEKDVEQSLGVIATQMLGDFAGPIVCVAVVMACLTTAVVLASLFASFLHKDILQRRLPYTICLIITLIISYFISIFKFEGISAFIGPILTALYPGLIVLTLLNIIHKIYSIKYINWSVYLTFIVTALGMVVLQVM